jgi:acetyl esterase
MSATEQRLTWLQKIVGAPPPGVVPPPPITSVEMIPQRREALHFDALIRNLPDVGQMHEEVLLRERDGVRLTAEIYVPDGDGPFPTMLYMHGGAWCVWSARDVRRTAMRIAASGRVVVNLDYGLAPEHPFPWAVEDAIYGARWTALNAAAYGGTNDVIAIGGDSAGANLSVAAIVLLDGGLESGLDVDEGDLRDVPVRFSAALLHCGAFDMRLLVHDERQTTPGTTEVMTYNAYLGSHWTSNLLNPLASPYYAPNLSCLPPSYLNCGADDPILAQTLRMTEKLAQAGVPVSASVVPGLDHDFFLMEEDPAVEREWERTLAWLGAHTALRAAPRKPH